MLLNQETVCVTNVYVCLYVCMSTQLLVPLLLQLRSLFTLSACIPPADLFHSPANNGSRKRVSLSLLAQHMPSGCSASYYAITSRHCPLYLLFPYSLRAVSRIRLNSVHLPRGHRFYEFFAFFSCKANVAEKSIEFVIVIQRIIKS